MKDLGEKIYEKNFPVKVRYRNDRNGHMNNSDYINCSEKFRQKLLREIGCRDGNFGGELVNMVMASRETDYDISLKKGDKILLRLEIFLKRKILHMNYTFVNSSGEEVATDSTKFVFKDFKEERLVDVPNFFLEKIRNS